MRGLHCICRSACTEEGPGKRVIPVDVLPVNQLGLSERDGIGHIALVRCLEEREFAVVDPALDIAQGPDEVDGAILLLGVGRIAFHRVEIAQVGEHLGLGNDRDGLRVVTEGLVEITVPESDAPLAG